MQREQLEQSVEHGSLKRLLPNLHVNGTSRRGLWQMLRICTSRVRHAASLLAEIKNAKTHGPLAVTRISAGSALGNGSAGKGGQQGGKPACLPTRHVLETAVRACSRWASSRGEVRGLRSSLRDYRGRHAVHDPYRAPGAQREQQPSPVRGRGKARVHRAASGAGEPGLPLSRSQCAASPRTVLKPSHASARRRWRRRGQGHRRSAAA